MRKWKLGFCNKLFLLYTKMVIGKKEGRCLNYYSARDIVIGKVKKCFYCYFYSLYSILESTHIWSIVCASRINECLKKHNKMFFIYQFCSDIFRLKLKLKEKDNNVLNILVILNGIEWIWKGSKMRHVLLLLISKDLVENIDWWWWN